MIISDIHVSKYVRKDLKPVEIIDVLLHLYKYYLHQTASVGHIPIKGFLTQVTKRKITKRK